MMMCLTLLRGVANGLSWQSDFIGTLLLQDDEEDYGDGDDDEEGDDDSDGDVMIIAVNL